MTSYGWTWKFPQNWDIHQNMTNLIETNTNLSKTVKMFVPEPNVETIQDTSVLAKLNKYKPTEYGFLKETPEIVFYKIYLCLVEYSKGNEDGVSRYSKYVEWTLSPTNPDRLPKSTHAGLLLYAYLMAGSVYTFYKPTYKDGVFDLEVQREINHFSHLSVDYTKKAIKLAEEEHIFDEPSAVVYYLNAIAYRYGDRYNSWAHGPGRVGIYFIPSNTTRYPVEMIKSFDKAYELDTEQYKYAIDMILLVANYYALRIMGWDYSCFNIEKYKTRNRGSEKFVDENGKCDLYYGIIARTLEELPSSIDILDKKELAVMYYTLGYKERAFENYDKTIELLETALSYYSHPDILKPICEIMLYTKQKTDAETEGWIQRYIRESPNDSRDYSYGNEMLSRLHMLRGNKSKMIDIAIESNHFDSLTRYYRENLDTIDERDFEIIVEYALDVDVGLPKEAMEVIMCNQWFTKNENNYKQLVNKDTYEAEKAYWAFRSEIRFGSKAGTISVFFSNTVPYYVTNTLGRMINDMCSNVGMYRSETGRIHSFGNLSTDGHLQNEIRQGLTKTGGTCDFSKVGFGFFIPFNAKRYDNCRPNMGIDYALSLLFRYGSGDWDSHIPDILELTTGRKTRNVFKQFCLALDADRNRARKVERSVPISTDVTRSIVATNGHVAVRANSLRVGISAVHTIHL